MVNQIFKVCVRCNAYIYVDVPAETKEAAEEAATELAGSRSLRELAEKGDIELDFEGADTEIIKGDV